MASTALLYLLMPSQECMEYGDLQAGSGDGGGVGAWGLGGLGVKVVSPLGAPPDSLATCLPEPFF